MHDNPIILDQSSIPIHRIGQHTIVFKTKPDFIGKCHIDYLQGITKECLFKAIDGHLDRLLRLGDRLLLIRLRELETGQLEVRLLNGVLQDQEAQFLANYYHTVFDLSKDLGGFYKCKDPIISALVNRYKGTRIIRIPDLFECICWGIIGQLINLNFAHTIKRQLVEKYGYSFEWEGQTYLAFPSVQTIAQLSEGDFEGIQLSKSKKLFIIGIAQAIVNNELKSQEIISRKSISEKQKYLLQFKGIGDWTAAYVLMKAFGEMEAYPYADAGLLNSLKK